MDNINSTINSNYNINYNTNSNNSNIPSITTQKLNRISEMTKNLAEVETLDFVSDSTIIPKIKNYTKEEYSKTVAEYTKELEQQKNMYKEAAGELDKIIAAIEYNLPHDPKQWIGKYKSKYDLEELKTISKEFTNFGSLKQLQEYKETLEQDKANLEASIYKINQTQKTAEYDFLDLLSDYQNFTSTKSNDRTEMSKIDFRQLYSKVYEGNLESYCSTNNIDINKINELEYVKMLKENGLAGYNSYYKDSDIDLLLQLNNSELIKKYNYCFETFGREKANEYLESISDTLHQQVGYIKAQEYLSTLKTDENGNYDNGAIMNYLNTIIKGGKTGWESFFNGISAWGESETIYSADEYESMYILQSLQQNQNFTNFLDNSFELSQSAGNMLPSVLIGTLTANPALATTLMGISSGGSSYHSALVSGHDKKEAIFYGTLSGLSEATLQYFLGGIPGLKQADDVVVKGFKGFCKEMGSEALEEGVQTVLDASLQTAILGEEFTAEQLTLDVLKSALYGAIMGGTFNATNIATSKLGNKVISAIKNKNNTNTNSNSPTIDNQVNEPTKESNDIVENVQQQNEINEKITIVPKRDLQKISWNDEIERAKSLSKSSSYGALILEVTDISNIPYNLFNMLQSDNSMRIKIGDRVYKPSEINNIMKNYIANMESGKISLEDQYNFWNKQGVLIEQIFNDYIESTEYKLAVQLNLRNQNGYQQSQEKADKIWGELNDIESKCEQLKESISKSQTNQQNIKSNLDKISEILDEWGKKNGYDNFAEYALRRYAETGSAYQIINDKKVPYITSTNGARSYIETLDPTAVSTYLRNKKHYSTLNSSSVEELNSFFQRTGSSYNQTYGVNQGGITNLCEYYLDGKKYSYRKMKEIVNEAKKNGFVIPSFEKIAIQKEYFELKNKLVTKGFTEDQASIILSSIDDVGACSYAAKANSIFYKFSKNPELFEELFGFPMYKTTKNGKKILNSNELLLDMYLYVNDTRNGGNLIHKNSNSNTYIFNHSDSIDVFGRLMLDTEQQVYMSTSAGSNNEVLSSYLNAKGLDWDSYALIKNNPNNVLSNNEFNKCIYDINGTIKEGKAIQLNLFSSGSEIRMINSQNEIEFTTKSWGEGGGHAVFITGMKKEGFLVSSWGKEYLIPFYDLQNGGRFTIMIDDIKVTN